MKVFTSHKMFEEYELVAGDAKFTFLFYDGSMMHAYQKGDRLYHTHSWYEFFYVINGELELQTMQAPVRVAAGDCALVPKDFLHYAMGDDGTNYIGFLIDIEKGKEDSKEHYIEEFRQILDVDAIRIMPRFDALGCFERFQIYRSGRYNDAGQLTLACLHEIIFLLKNALVDSSHDIEQPITLENERFRNLIIDDYMNSGYCEAPSLDILAERLHISRQQLQRIIKKRYHQSFSERILFLKMQKAQRLLSETDESVGEIAARLGYSSTCAFFTTFKKYFGVTPRQYRNKV